MKILRIGISDDHFGPVRMEERSWYIVQERMAETIGEPVETVRKTAWPNDAYPDVIERWVEREQPDAVFLCAASYWVSFPSAPRAVESSRLPFARQLSAAAVRLSTRPAIAHNSAFRLARRLALRTVGYRYFFEPEEAAARVEAALRRILRHEEIAVAVRGPMPLGLPLPARIAVDSRRRCAEFDRLLAGICERLHVAYQPPGPDEPPSPAELQSDLTHVNAAGHARRARHEFDVLLSAWTAHHPLQVR